MAQLQFYRDGTEIMRLRLDGEAKTFGRGSSSGAVLLDSDVSRQQFSVRLENHRWILTNLSRFGTSVGGKREEGEVELQGEAVIEFARWRVVFRLVPDATLDDDPKCSPQTPVLPNPSLIRQP